MDNVNALDLTFYLRILRRNTKMSLQVEKLEKNMAKLTIEVSAEDLDKAMEKAYQKQKSRISLPGFRKGKAPRKMIESMYGKGVFMEDAVNSLVPQEYTKALGECDLEIVSQPEINVTQMEPGKALIFTADVAVKPEVTLGDYKGVEVPKSEIAVTDEEVDAEVKKEQDKNARTVAVEDRAAANGDITTIDFEGFVDGVAFEGGKGTDYALTLGSGTFIPGFEDQLVGANTGDHVEVKVTFPEEYQAKELAGKEAVFQCDVKKIETKEVPELDDEFAKDVSEFDTLAEYKEDVKKKLTEKKEKEARTAKENAAVDKAIENAQMDIPELMTKTECRQMMDDFSRRMQQQGLSMEQYFQFTGQSMDKMMEDMKPQALKRIQTRLVLEKVAEAENIQPSEEEITEEIQKMADAYKMEADKIREAIGESGLEQMKKDMAVQKAVTVIADAAVEVEKAADAE
jgi:trigger factor